MGKILIVTVLGVLKVSGGLCAAPLHSNPSIGLQRDVASEMFRDDDRGGVMVSDADGGEPAAFQANSATDFFEPESVPEPETTILCGSALLALGLWGRRYAARTKK